MENMGYDRNKLYEEVWKEPMVIVAKRYSISNITLKNICSQLQIPTPGKGYWTIVRSGKKVKRPPLPKLIISEDTGDTNNNDKNQLNPVIFLDTQLNRINQAYSLIRSKQYTNHRKITLKIARAKESTKLYKSHPAEPKPLNIMVSPPSKDRALSLMDTIVRVITYLGSEIIIDDKKAYAVINDEKLRIYIDETFNKKLNRKVLRLNLDVLEAARGVWSDSDKCPIENKICEYVNEMYNTADRIKQCREAERMQEVRSYERNHEKERFKKLEEAAIDWQRSQIIENFIKAIEQNISSDLQKQYDLFDWLEWAKGKAEWLNPVIGRKDPILGKKHGNIFDDEK